MPLEVPPFVSQDWWRAHAGEAVLVEVLHGPGARPQVAGAVAIDLERWLAGVPGGGRGRHPLPSPEVFAEGLGRVRLSDDDVVVACDDAAGVFAARLVWMLRVTGRSAALLDGGPPGGAGPGVARPAVHVAPRPWPEHLLVDADEAAGPGHVLLDARQRERFVGGPDPLDPRPGHVPGARSLPCREAVGPDGLLLPDEVLRARFAAVGVTGDEAVVSSCGSGVTACHTLLVLEHLGLPAGRLWPGSWSQWASDPDRPAELG